MQEPDSGVGRSLRGVLAVTWFEHRRTRELCAGLALELALVDTRLRGVRRYLLLSLRTLVLLARQRPRVLLVQNPSLVLAVLAVMLRPIFGYRLIADAHNEAVAPYENRQRFIKELSRWVVRRADLTIVTNRQLAQLVTLQGGTPYVLPDRIPTPPAGGPAPAPAEGFRVVLIATFARDEPVAAVFEAVRGADLQLQVTGNQKKLAPSVTQGAPPNVRFTGFLSDADYWQLLRSADVIIDLTLKADCLVCGAYEALAVGKPMLLSNNAACMELFGGSALYTDNTAQDIRRCLEQLRNECVPMAGAVALQRSQLAAAWLRYADALGALLRVWAAA
jgi:glycosyltransferase involved in cell wall biosynthesis